MNNRSIKHIKFSLLLLALLVAGSMDLCAQNAKQRRQGIPRDSLTSIRILSNDSIVVDSLAQRNQRELQLLESPIDTTKLAFQADSVQHTQLPKKRFIPNPNRAIWLALVFPGAGQIYNRKYWKLPIVYGGFVGCTYALNWNNKMYKDYSQAYLDIMDDDPNTKSYEDFLPLNSSISGQESRYKELFKKRKDMFRRQRDLSIFCFIGVYLLSVIDAYVDAELSDFDITKDLGLKIEPAIINDNKTRNFNSVGLQCSLKF
ncbi:MAG: hypothetical protein J6I70_05175 [Bacteroidaceae bacterium]|nr:hypothetical protein [Bacteroidaceae bacterium]